MAQFAQHRYQVVDALPHHVAIDGIRGIRRAVTDDIDRDRVELRREPFHDRCPARSRASEPVQQHQWGAASGLLHMQSQPANIDLTHAITPAALAVLPIDVVYRREAGVAPPMPPFGRREL